jgi:hypothetical protein
MYDKLMAATSPYSRSHYCEIAHLVDGSAQAQLGELFRRGCRRAPMPEGSLLLWNSRTLHQAMPRAHVPLSNREFSEAAARDALFQGWTSGRRLAQPVCWEPKSRRGEAALVRKTLMSIRGLPSTHWASLGNNRWRCRWR